MVKAEFDGAKASFLKGSGAATEYNYVDEYKQQNYGVGCKERKERFGAVGVMWWCVAVPHIMARLDIGSWLEAKNPRTWVIESRIQELHVASWHFL